MEAPVKLSIAAVSYHDPLSQLLDLLRSLAATAQELAGRTSSRVDLTIVDNSEDSSLLGGDGDSLRAEAERLGLGLRIISGHGNIGYGKAHNLLLRELDSQIHLMLNTDVTLDAHALTEVADYFDRQPGAVMLSPFAVDRKGVKQYLCKRYPSLFTLALRGFLPLRWRAPFWTRLARYEMRELPEDRPTAGIPIISGCCMICRTATLKAIHGFDPDFFLYFEDFDLSLRMASQGDIVYVPSIRIMHDGGNTARKGLRHIGLFIRSAIGFFRKHGWRSLKQ